MIKNLNVYIYPALAVGVFLGIIGLFSLTPLWNTQSRTVSASPQSDAVIATDEGEVKLVSTDDILGSWTLGDAATTFKAPAAEIKAHYNMPADTADTTALKDITKTTPDFDTEVLREWLKERSPVAKKELR